MKPYIELYCNFFGIAYGEFLGCEICGTRVTEIHHIHRRGAGGTKLPDEICNLMALCREHHIKYGDKKQFKEYLYYTHLKHLLSIKPDYQIKEKYLKYLEYNPNL